MYNCRGMPNVFRERGFRFFFYSDEGSPHEPVHIHVVKDNLEAKFWLNPTVRVADNKGYMLGRCAWYRGWLRIIEVGL